MESSQENYSNYNEINKINKILINMESNELNNIYRIIELITQLNQCEKIFNKPTIMINNINNETEANFVNNTSVTNKGNTNILYNINFFLYSLIILIDIRFEPKLSSKKKQKIENKVNHTNLPSRYLTFDEMTCISTDYSKHHTIYKSPYIDRNIEFNNVYSEINHSNVNENIDTKTKLINAVKLFNCKKSSL